MGGRSRDRSPSRRPDVQICRGAGTRRGESLTSRTVAFSLNADTLAAARKPIPPALLSRRPEQFTDVTALLEKPIKLLGAPLVAAAVRQ